jgi:peptidoglycan/LPS O-acetylase OafA/YrhL
MRSQHIRALTGVRFFAALWVVLYHCTRHNRAVLVEDHGDLHAVFSPLTSAGVRGVDLFFMLSGFVLALNYMDRLGGRLEFRTTLRFLWLRLARIWPLYMLVIIGAGLLRIIRHDLWDSAGTKPVTWTNLLRQGLMVQQWFPPDRGPTSWVGPAWSLSAEWLAYLLFPVLVLVVARVHRRLRARTLLVLAGLTMVPLVAGIVEQGNMGGNVWILRILCEFTTGMLLCAAASRLRLTPQVRQRAGVGALVSVAAVVAWLYAVRALGGEFYWSVSVVVLFAPLIFFLAIGTGPLHNLLATRALVLGGGISYALYLVHSPMLNTFRDVTEFTGVFYLEPRMRVYAELMFIPVMVLVAYLLYRFFEEPVRKLMRGMLDIPFSRVRGPVPAPPEDVQQEGQEETSRVP